MQGARVSVALLLSSGMMDRGYRYAPPFAGDFTAFHALTTSRC